MNITQASTLLDDGKSIVETARKHYQPVIAPAGQRWNALLARMREAIPRFTGAVEAIRYAQSELNFDHRSPADLSGFRTCSKMLETEFPRYSGWLPQMSESPFSLPESIAPLHGRHVSNVFFWHLRYVMQCLRWVKEPDCICEIGGGYGGPARLWLMNPQHSIQTYCIIDFPECLFFAEVFLKVNFEGLRVRYISDEEPALEDAPQVILCPIRQIDALREMRFDLVINTGSMQEMTEEWVDRWMQWLAYQDCRWFYSLNYFGQPLKFMAEAGNTYSPRLPCGWQIRHQEFNPPFVRTQSDRNFGEIIAEKTAFIHSPEALRLLRHTLASLPMNGQRLMEYMDLLRYDPGDWVMLEVLRRAIAEMPEIPKEAFWLAEHLQAKASDKFHGKHGAELVEIYDQLSTLRSSGIEGTYV